MGRRALPIVKAGDMVARWRDVPNSHHGLHLSLAGVMNESATCDVFPSSTNIMFDTGVHIPTFDRDKNDSGKAKDCRR